MLVAAVGAGLWVRDKFHLRRNTYPPQIAAGIDLRSMPPEEWSARLRQRFPIGTPEGRVIDVLESEGFRPVYGEDRAFEYAYGLNLRANGKYGGGGWSCQTVLRAWWDARNGKVTRMTGSVVPAPNC